MRTRRNVLGKFGTTGAVALGAGLAGCSGDDGGGGGGNTVEMTDSLTFEPGNLTVSTGTTVTWENGGTVAHTVTAYEDRIPSGATYFASGGYESETAARDGFRGGDAPIEADGSFEHTVDIAGSYEYFCIPHEGSGMTGTITVEE
ncbi:plastocyanin [Salinarchaeum sp. Harcht-Bsk1]|uniref:plastocyanin/azurin family copper-binding protein n=1 Tax=Salinarchaeum sp. Harcht-Bsk1 TaxID=1333523 RepID=UPI0003423877|nr:plastocyanin [Salinarchaeum sp. Harcht-Bsk1]